MDAGDRPVFAPFACAMLLVARFSPTEGPRTPTGPLFRFDPAAADAVREYAFLKAKLNQLLAPGGDR